MKILRSLAHLIGIYKIYEKLLTNEVKSSQIPAHVAFILDGNRRWARSKGLPPWLGHEYGAQKVDEILTWCYDLGIKVITLYVLSTENIFRRSEEELERLFSIIEKYLDKALESDKLYRYHVRFKAIGDLSLLPQNIVSKIRELEKNTKRYSERFLNIAIGYGGRKEIIDAVRKITKDVLKGKIDTDSINESLFERYLYTSDLPHPSPDLVIRTSGEIRLSNFLLWQVAYSELVFMDVFWPEFRKIDLLRAVRTYQKRKRRFGA